VTDHDDLDQRLRAYAERWRGRLPEPARPHAVATPTDAHRSRWLIPLIAAAVLAVAVGITYASRGSQRPEPPPSDTPGVVPWAPLPATHPTLPTQTTPPSPDPADVAAARACTDADLDHSPPQTDGAGGTTYLTVTLVLTGPSPCRLEGRPDVLLLDHGAPVDVPVQPWQQGGESGTVQPVLVTPAHPAVATVAWAVSHTCPAVDNDRIEITLSAGFTPFSIRGFGRSTCSPGDAASAVLVDTIRSRDEGQAQVTSPYDGLRASGDLDLTAQPGEPVHFEVTLTSAHDVVLDPCPDYAILTSAGEQRYALNCAAVPHHDAQGRPYLPSGMPVTFAMQADPGTQSTPKFLWSLATPESAADVVGTLTMAGDELEGTVSGTVLMAGGPAPGVKHKVIEGKVRAVREDGLTRGALISNSEYQISLPPGRYQLEVATPQYLDGAFGCEAEQNPVTVRPGETQSIAITCSMK
jgi:hypothetical protein